MVFDKYLCKQIGIGRITFTDVMHWINGLQILNELCVIGWIVATAFLICVSVEYGIIQAGVILLGSMLISVVICLSLLYFGKYINVANCPLKKNAVV